VDITQDVRGHLADVRGHHLKGNHMQDIVDTRSCQIKLDAQDKPAPYAADGVTLQDPTIVEKPAEGPPVW
jgi:hypothetical protein